MGIFHWDFQQTCRWTIFYLSLMMTGIRGANAVEIRRFSVPRWIENGTEDSVVLDCEYSYNENDLRLVVKWFFDENLEPVYQWIPELNRVHISGVLRGRLDRSFVANAADAYSRFRALKIERPSTELSGKYTCLVTSLAGQDSREQVMTVFVPAKHFDLSYIETRYDQLNVSCEANGLFPVPQLTLYIRPSSGSPPRNVTDVRPVLRRRSNSAYDIYLHRTFTVSELATSDGTVFECLLELPGTNYVQTKTIAYFPGIQRQRDDLAYEFESSCPPLALEMVWIRTVACCILIVHLFRIHVEL